MEVVGKYTWSSRPPDSYRASPRGNSTSSKCGDRRSNSAAGMAARRWFCVAEEAVDIPAPGELCAQQGTASQPAKPVNCLSGHWRKRRHALVRPALTIRLSRAEVAGLL